MGKGKQPKTLAIRALGAAGVAFEMHPYAYERSGTRASSAALALEEHAVIKTLVMEDSDKSPLIVLMHGDLEVSLKELARVRGVKSVAPCDPKTAQRHTGYQVGGTSPFGTRKRLDVYAERSIQELERLWINGGRRGLLVSMAPEALASLAPRWVDVATGRH